MNAEVAVGPDAGTHGDCNIQWPVVGALGIEPSLSQYQKLALWYGTGLLLSLTLFGRGAENRTRTTWSQTRRTTTILLPEKVSGY